MSNLWSRKSNAFERSVNKAPKSFPLPTHVSIFLTFSNCNVEYYSLSKIRIDILRKHCQRKQIFERTLSFQTFSIKLEIYQGHYIRRTTIFIFSFCVGLVTQLNGSALGVLKHHYIAKRIRKLLIGNSRFLIIIR